LAASLLRPFDPWRGRLCTCPPKLSLNPYTRCSHGCLYCYATAYVGRGASVPKKNLLKRLEREAHRLDRRLPVELSTSSDPYPPEEEQLQLTRRAVRLLLEHGFKLLILSKSDLVLRDLDLIRSQPVSVSITVTTLDPSLAGLIEPRAPPPQRRLECLSRLSRAGVPVSARVDPVIPGLNDDPDGLRELVAALGEAGVKHVVTATYKARPDSLARLAEAFPDLAGRWRALYVGEGVWVDGYWYMDSRVRRRLLRPVVEEAARRGLSYATCREGLTADPRFFSAPTCDGTHLIPKPRDARGKLEW